jgi:hypothetical protein
MGRGYEALYDDDCDCYRPGESDYDPDDASLEALDVYDSLWAAWWCYT